MSGCDHKKWKGQNKAPRHPAKPTNRKDIAHETDAKLIKAAEEEPLDEPIVPAADYEAWLYDETTTDDFETWKLKLCGLYREKPKDSEKKPMSFAV